MAKNQRKTMKKQSGGGWFDNLFGKNKTACEKAADAQKLCEAETTPAPAPAPTPEPTPAPVGGQKGGKHRRTRRHRKNRSSKSKK